MRANMNELDERDAAIRTERIQLLDAIEGPRVGDYILFRGGIVRRISHVWDFGDGDEPEYQTSDGGSWHLGDGYCSFSGSLYPAVKRSTLIATEPKKSGVVWFFHHDHWCANNGVQTEMDFRVYACTEEATK